MTVVTATELCCVHCGTPSDLTRDHVPPKCFFPKPLPSNLITVPACARCNQGMGLDEEHFLATVMFGEAGISATGKNLWSEKLSRMHEKNRGLRKRIARAMSYADVFSKGGIYLGRRMTIDVDQARVARVVHKILRGLYFFEFGERVPANATIAVLWLQSKEHFAMAWKHRAELRPGRRGWQGVFEYACNRVAGASCGSSWQIVLFEAVAFSAVLQPAKVLTELPASA
jgi:hypothetical protein